MVMKDYVVIYKHNDAGRVLSDHAIVRKVDSPAQALIESGFAPVQHLDVVQVIEMVFDTFPHNFDVLPPVTNLEWRQR